MINIYSNLGFQRSLYIQYSRNPFQTMQLFNIKRNLELPTGHGLYMLLEWALIAVISNSVGARQSLTLHSCILMLGLADEGYGVALLGPSSWWWPGVLVCVCASLRVSTGDSRLLSYHSSHEMTPFGSTALYSVQKILFGLHRTLSYLILPPTQEAGNTNCVMPILWMVIYSGEIDLPKMPSVVELANPSAWLFHYTTGIESFNELFTEHLACVSHCARTYSSACSPERNFFKSPTSHPPPHAINDEF